MFEGGRISRNVDNDNTCLYYDLLSRAKSWLNGKQYWQLW